MTRYTGSINGRNDSETFHVELARGKRYIIDLKGTSSEDGLRDPLLNIIGDRGQFFEDNNGGTGNNAQIAFRPVGTRFFDVSVLGNAGSTGDFVLDVNRDDFRNGIVGSAPAGSVPTDGRARSGHINYDGDVDVFAVNLVAGLTYNFRMLTHHERSLSDARLTLLNPRGNERAEGDDCVSEGEPFISFEARQTGEYWLRARASDDETGAYGFAPALVEVPSEATVWPVVTPTTPSMRWAETTMWVVGPATTPFGARRARTRWPGATGRTGFWVDWTTTRSHGRAGSDQLLGEGGRDSLGGGEGNDG